ILGMKELQARRGRLDASVEEPVYMIDSVTNNPGAAGGIIVSQSGKLLGMIGRELRGTETETWINFALPASLLQTRFQELADASSGAPPADMAANQTPTRRAVDLGIVLVPNVTTRTPAFVTDILNDTAGDQA